MPLLLTACCICRQVPYLVLFTHFWELLCPHSWAFLCGPFHSVHTGSDDTLHQTLPEPCLSIQRYLASTQLCRASFRTLLHRCNASCKGKLSSFLCSCEVYSWSHEAYACCISTHISYNKNCAHVYIHTHMYVLLLIYMYTLCMLCRWLRVATTNRAGSRAFLGCFILVCWRHCWQNQL